MKSIYVNFQNKNKDELSARLELPPRRKPFAFAIFAHCFTCNKNLLAINNISRALTSRGIAVFRFDFTGLGESDGEFSDSNFSSSVEDLKAAAEYLKDHYSAPSVIIGHSLGGTAAIMAASEIESIRAVIAIGAPSDPSHVKKLLGANVSTIRNKGRAEVNIGGRPFVIKDQFIEDIEQKDLSKILKELRKPLLILHSPQDRVVEIKNAAKLYESAHHPKSFISLDGADHLLTKKEDSSYVGTVIGSWLGRYLDEPDRKLLKTDKQVAARIKEDYTTEIVAGKHFFIADEPEEVGGNDFGPSPYDFLSASLAACTAMTIRMYADRKKWQLESMEVHIEHEKKYFDDAENPEKENKKLDYFERLIRFEGKLDQSQVERLLEIADKCPVHKTLHSEVHVNTQIIE